jgi:hypothetical protein
MKTAQLPKGLVRIAEWLKSSSGMKLKPAVFDGKRVDLFKGFNNKIQLIKSRQISIQCVNASCLFCIHEDGAYLRR